MFSFVAMKVEFLTSWFSLSRLSYKKKINDTNSSHNKLRSQIENKVRLIIRSDKHNKIYNSCSLQLKQIIAIKIILFIVLNVDL